MSGILKYMQVGQSRQDGQPDLHWGRASIDGLPLRAAGKPPLLRDEEFENRAIRVCDAKVRTFDTSDPDELTAYQQVLDRAANNWYCIFHTQRHWDPDKKCMIVYVEWGENFMEDSRAFNMGQPS